MQEFPYRALMLQQFPPSQTCLCLILCSLLFFSDRVTAAGFQNVSRNVNMLTYRYRICSLMCMTMGDPHLGFCLSCYRDLTSHSATSHVSPFKIPQFVLFTAAFCSTHAHNSVYRHTSTHTDTYTNTHTDNYRAFQMLLKDCFHSSPLCFSWGLNRCVSLNTLLSYLHTPPALDLKLHPNPLSFQPLLVAFC